MDYGELLVGGAIGVLLGVLLGAFLRPIAVSIERRARAFWGQDPVLVHVERDPKIIWSGLPDWITFSMYIDDPQRLSGSPSPGRDGWLDYMYGINAVDAYQTTLKVTIQAKVDAAVAIERVRVVSHRQIPLSKGVVITRGTGGADLTPRRFEIDLEGASEPLIAFLPEHGGQEISPPSFVLAAGDVERFHIWAKTSWENHDSPTWHEWSIALDMLVEGRMITRVIDNNGRPFVTVSPGSLPYGTLTDEGATWHDPRSAAH